MGLTGFNETAVRSCLSNIQIDYNNLIYELQARTQKRFVDTMANYWACQDAIDFFTKFQENFNSLIGSTNQVYASIYNSIKEAAEKWGKTTGEAINPISDFNMSTTLIDISCIKKQFANGDRGVYIKEATDTAGVLNDPIFITIKNVLDNTKTHAESSGFLGGEQQESLNNTLNTLRDNMETIFGDQTSAASQAISTSASNYGSFSSNVSDAFRGTQQEE